MFSSFWVELSFLHDLHGGAFEVPSTGLLVLPRDPTAGVMVHLELFPERLRGSAKDDDT